MLDTLEGALSRGRTVLVGWILPFGLAMSTFALLEPPSKARGIALYGLVVVVGGVLLNLFRTPMYRVLSGNLLWPTRLADLRRTAQFDRRNRLRAKAADQHGVDRALAAERARRFPAVSDQIAPTLLGNAIRRVETYGFDRYRLDSQVLWQELRSVAPPALVRDEQRARSAVDFFVCLTYSLVLLAFASMLVLLRPEPWMSGSEPLLGHLTVSVLALAGAFGAYRGAVQATDRWAAAVRALVNLGRVPLSEALGLRIPESLEDEREMWRRVNWIVRLDYDEHMQAELNPYRDASV